MADGTNIEWTDATWNPITGCSVVSPGCTNCYAMKLAGTRLAHHPSRAGLTRDSNAGPVWTGEVRFNEQWLHQPLQWTRPRRIFVCAHGDLFHPGVPDGWIARVWHVIGRCPQHQFQVLTKRSDRMREWVSRWADLSPALPNVWLGVSVEDQPRADDRIPDLLATPAAVRFLSCEPLLGPIDLAWCRAEDEGLTQPLRDIDWVIAGGESGPSARPMRPDWARSLRDRCNDAGVPFFFKQWGAWVPADVEHSDAMLVSGDGSVREPGDGGKWANVRMQRTGKKAAGARLDGREHKAFPDG